MCETRLGANLKLKIVGRKLVKFFAGKDVREGRQGFDYGQGCQQQQGQGQEETYLSILSSWPSGDFPSSPLILCFRVLKLSGFFLFTMILG